jgi:metal-dependent amidase/aminoacylase/carboxypeptidase family protein
MQIPHLINLLHGEMTAWRQDLHPHPELGFEEHRTLLNITESREPGRFSHTATLRDRGNINARAVAPQLRTSSDECKTGEMCQRRS